MFLKSDLENNDNIIVENDGAESLDKDVPLLLEEQLITFFGLEPREDRQDTMPVPPFVGTIILLASVYFTFTVFFTDNDPFASGIL